MTDDKDEPSASEVFKALEPIKDTAVSPATGIGALALGFALKYHDINTVQDGQLYQQYKLEGKNLQTLHLDHVFETAVRMELHLLGTSQRIAKVVIDAITEGDKVDEVIDAMDEAAQHAKSDDATE